MSQTSVIFFGLLVGFVVFITVRGELAAYLNVLGIGGKSATVANPLYGMNPADLGLNSPSITFGPGGAIYRGGVKVN